MAKKATNQETAIIVNNLTIKAADRSAVDIKKWKEALQSADRGRKSALLDLYTNILIDPYLSDSLEKRIEAIINADIVYSDATGKADPVIDTLIDTLEFENLLKSLYSFKIWGGSMTMVDFTPEGKLTVWDVPKKHIRIDKKMIVFDQNDETGYSIEGDDRFIMLGDTKDHGLILKACPYVIYKRGGFGDWAQFAEIFGMPFRKATYSAQDEATRVLLEKAMEKAGAAMYGIFPEGAGFEILDSKTQGNGALYKLLRDACNEEILVSILGQTMTTMNGSSRSQSETHMEVQLNKHKADRRLMQRLLNEYFLPFLISRGYVKPGGWFSLPEKGESISLKDRITIDTELANMIDIPVNYFYDTYGIPKPEKEDEIAGEGESPDSPENNTEKKDKSLAKRLAGFFVQALRKGAPLDF